MLNKVESRIGLLASGNWFISGWDRFFTNSIPALSALLIVCQIAVALFTVYYIIKKTKQVGKSDKEKSKDDSSSPVD